MKKLFKTLLHIYHKLLELFCEFDIGIYAISNPQIPTTRIFDYEYTDDVKINELITPKFECKTTELKPPVVISYKTPSLKDLLKIKNISNELFHALKIKEENLIFNFVARKYEASLNRNPDIFKAKLLFFPQINKSEKKDIYIERSLKTIEELLELEPYTHKHPIKNIQELSISKYPIKKEKFTEEQLDTIRTKLALQAKCKKYSINIENIYDKFPIGLYEEIKIEKNGAIKCKYAQNPTLGELQLLVTGKRKYDTKITSTYIKYSEVGL